MSVTETSQTFPRFDGGVLPVTIATSGVSGPGIVVVSSAYGVTEDLRATMRRFAAHGHVLVAPDMFSRTVPGPLGQSDAEKQAARGRLEGFDFAGGLRDIKTVMDELVMHPDCNGKVAVLGYCFGGEFAYVAPSELGTDGAVSFHGVGIGKHLALAASNTVPMSLHFGEDDRFVPNTEVDEIEAAHRGQANVGVYRYANAKHGFMQSDNAVYDKPAAELAEERALAMLATLK